MRECLKSTHPQGVVSSPSKLSIAPSERVACYSVYRRLQNPGLREMEQQAVPARIKLMRTSKQTRLGR